jgi:ribosomal-protein-alanine N-acetyltransferase
MNTCIDERMEGELHLFPVLETKRLVLRELSENDCSTLYKIYSDENILKYYGVEAFSSESDAINLISAYNEKLKSNQSIRWGIELKETGELIGTCGFHLINSKHRRAELGYELLPKFWRNKYSSEALIKIIDFAFNELCLIRIGAIVFLENDASLNLLYSLGFRREGLLRDYMTQYEKSYDVFVLSLTKKEW